MTAFGSVTIAAEATNSGVACGGVLGKVMDVARTVAQERKTEEEYWRCRRTHR